ncbi:MAG: hypothetical protein NCW75_08695 [Phycisphaera sp.]|nr:MAG: hypothetical protein NCW75_08695 [Phycisphaera sp.]
MPAVLVVLCCAPTTHAALQPVGESRGKSNSEIATPASDPIAVLASAADEPARLQAAREVLKRFATDSGLSVARSWFAEEPAASLRLLDATAEEQSDAEALAGALVRTLRVDGENGDARWSFDGISSDARSACQRILSRSLEPASCEALIAWLEASTNGQRRAVAQALMAMTGREDLAASPEAWRQWFARHQHLPPLAWRTMLADGVRARAERLAERERELLARLTDSSRRLYAALPASERPAVLASMLADAEPAVRLLATDLLLRDLERGVLPSPEVAAALIALLEDPQAQIRQAAAVLVDRIVPAGSAPRLSVALRKETEPEVAAVMLRAFRRSPDAAAIDAVLRWLEHGEPTRTGAMRAVQSLVNTGFTPTPDQTERILAIANADESTAWVPSGVAVLAQLGKEQGRTTVRSLLFSDRAEIRRAAADALAALPQHVEDLLVAAEADPALLQYAADAIARHKPWAPLLRRVALLELSTPTDGTALEPLPITSALARFMPVGERLAAAQELARRPLAVRAILGQPTRKMFVEGPAGDRAFAQARSLLGLPEPKSEPTPETAAPPESSQPAEQPAEIPPGG